MSDRVIKTPMVRQYLSIKEKYKDAILFFRLGDFYEMFFDEAVEVSRILNLTLTKRNNVPMCGIPYHAYKVYVARLLRAGKKIAICEQVSEPLPGELTKREVTEVITPALAVEDDFLESGKDNYLLAIYCASKKNENMQDYYDGIAYIDVSSGSFFCMSFLRKDTEKELFKELGRLSPSEILIPQSLERNQSIMKRLELEYPHVLKNTIADSSFNAEKAFNKLCHLFGTESLKAFGLEKTSPELPAAGVIIEYLEQTSHSLLLHISSITHISESDFVGIDHSTRKNLELIYNLNDNTTNYTLFEVVNSTKTSMGTRLLRRMLQQPIRAKDILNERLNKVSSLIENKKALNLIRSSISSISDVERLTSRITMQKAQPRELLSLTKSLSKVKYLHSLISENNLSFFALNDNELNRLNELYSLLESSINEECPVSITEGGLIKKGFNKEVDRLAMLHENAQSILEKYVTSEREKTGIQNLKIKYNRMIGYFLEVSKSYWDKVPPYFIKKRSISNSDRFSTDELDEIVSKITGAEEALVDLEKELFIRIREEVGSEHKILQKMALEIAELDVFQSLAQVAINNHWKKPEFTDDGSLVIINGRHPVVEVHLPSGEFIPNSISLSSETNEKKDFELKQKLPAFAIITGPNMAGKSTFLRQTALIVLLAQIGSYVPADKVLISPVDKIFCRVGASDNLARGESTFLVEMTETSYILQTATNQSLVIMDEVGRGTSTEDGMAIAQSCSEYLLNKIGAKTLFATHYRELTKLEHPALENLKLDIMESEGKIVFLKKVVEGVSKSSYGLHVAALAGLPKEVIERAKNLLHMHTSFNGKVISNNEQNEESEEKKLKANITPSLFGEELLIINDILSQDLNNITPLTALQKISEWQKQLM